jgi:mycothiol synthase
VANSDNDTSLPAGYAFRPLGPDDLDAVADVLIADEIHDSGQSTLGADFIRMRWSRPGFDLTTDAWAVAEQTGRIVAYGQVGLVEPGLVDSWGSVHPDHRGRGIGTAVFDRIDGRAAALLAGVEHGRFRHAIIAVSEDAAAILRAHGLRLVRHFWHMQIDLAGPVDPGPAPDGIEFMPVETDDDVAVVHGVIEEAFAEHWGHRPMTLERWLENQARPGFDQTLWLIARDGDRAAGVLTASAGADRGWIDYLGILAAYRRRGIGAALIRRAFAAFADRGFDRVALSVDAANATGATALYESQGMLVAKVWDMWERSEA